MRGQPLVFGVLLLAVPGGLVLTTPDDVTGGVALSTLDDVTVEEADPAVSDDVRVHAPSAIKASTNGHGSILIIQR